MGIICSKSEGVGIFGFLLFWRSVCWGKGGIKVRYPFLFHHVSLLSLLLDIKCGRNVLQKANRRKSGKKDLLSDEWFL